jgi:hypothetical protein
VVTAIGSDCHVGRAPSWFAVGWLMVTAVLAGCASHGEAVSSCSAAPVAVTEADSIASGSENGSCEGVTALITWSDGAPGSACTDPTQCRPTCCACSTAGRSALTSWCNEGVCASPADVCCALAGTSTKSCGD